MVECKRYSREKTTYSLYTGQKRNKKILNTEKNAMWEKAFEQFDTYIGLNKIARILANSEQSQDCLLYTSRCV